MVLLKLSSSDLCLFSSDMMYGSRYTLDDVVQSMKKTGVGLKGRRKSLLWT